MIEQGTQFVKSSDDSCVHDRRQVLALLGAGMGLSALGSTGSVAASAPAAARDWQDPRTLLDSMLKLRASLDARPVYMWLLGHRYLVMPDGRSLPLCSMSNCSVTRSIRKSDESFELTVLEYNYNTDFETREWRDSLVMPVTGRAVPTPQGRAEPVRHEWRLRYAYEGRLDEAHEFSEATLERYGADAQLTIDRTIHPPDILGNEIAFTQDWYLRVAPADRGKRGWWVREVSTVRGALRDVVDRRQNYVPSRTSYSIVYDLQPWMQLEGVGGYVLTTAVGGKAARAGDLPEGIRRLMAQRNPESLGDPERLLKGGAGV
jgi:Protein of unknown function (DUF1838)